MWATWVRGKKGGIQEETYALVAAPHVVEGFEVAEGVGGIGREDADVFGLGVDLGDLIAYARGCV